MATESIFFKILLFFLASMALFQIYIIYRMRKARDEAGASGTNPGEQHLTSKETLLFSLLHTGFFIFAVLWALYSIRSGILSAPVGIVLIVVAFLIERKPISLVLKNRPRPVPISVNLALWRPHDRRITPEYIQEVLSEECVINAIKNDLRHVKEIGGRERWRLGLITPGHDVIDPSITHLSLMRAAVLRGSTAFNSYSNDIQISQPASAQVAQGYQGMHSYPLEAKLAEREIIRIRDLHVTGSGEKNPCLPELLRQEGFPIKESYLDGDPLTTERGGTIVIDKDALKIIYPDYFVQRSLMDDQGNLLYMGLDENFGPDSSWNRLDLIPSISERLYKSVEYHGYIPIVRYRSFPCNSEFMLPILDTPLSDSRWADLFINPRGRAKLFIAREKTLDQWYALMESLRQLFFRELARKGNRLLAFTKDEYHMHEYFCKKQAILDDYFITLDWSLPRPADILSLSPSQV
jgi:hypothetical protein